MSMDKPASALMMAQTPAVSLIKCKRLDYFGGQVIAACIYLCRWLSAADSPC